MRLRGTIPDSRTQYRAQSLSVVDSDWVYVCSILFDKNQYLSQLEPGSTLEKDY